MPCQSVIFEQILTPQQKKLLSRETLLVTVQLLLMAAVVQIITLLLTAKPTIGSLQAKPALIEVLRKSTFHKIT